MRFLFLILSGLFSGVFAGMGMGGGTFLVPILAMFFGVEQILCQSTNVICFLVLAIVCFVIYSSKKLIDYRVMLTVGLPAMLIAGGACLLSLRIHSKILKFIFAGFIILIGVISFVMSLLQKKTQK